GEKSALKNVLDLERLDNIVIVSNLFGNSLALEFEDHESVEALVMTSAFKGVDSLPPRLIYNQGWRTFTNHPKLLKKYFFSDNTDFKVVKEFAEILEKPEYLDAHSFVENYRFSRPVKKSLVVHSDEDRFSSIDFARELDRPNISRLSSAGGFPFFEKPEEYNKVLHDFLRSLRQDKKREELEKVKQNNSSLTDFTRKKRKTRKMEKKVKKTV
ncbi:MAG: pimeloyl-ACP methyl ester carboxylesterase, partial [Candidatus Nanohaloarchaea archaeon]